MTVRLDGIAEDVIEVRAYGNAIEQALNLQPERVASTNTTATTKNASVILFQLSGPAHDIQLEFYLGLDAAATFTVTFNKNRAGDLVTQVAEAVATITTPAANAHYHYSLGDLAEMQEGQVIIAQDNAGAATVVCDAVLKADI